jgi:hypothetical protein
MKGKDGLLWNGEVVDECRDEDDTTDGDGRCNHWHGVSGTSEVCDTHEEDDKTGSEETKTDKIQLFEFLPSGSFIISLWARWRIVGEIGTDEHEARVDDTDVVTPSPGGLEIKLSRDITGKYCVTISDRTNDTAR